jgi:hypothetical protein
MLHYPEKLNMPKNMFSHSLFYHYGEFESAGGWVEML